MAILLELAGKLGMILLEWYLKRKSIKDQNAKQYEQFLNMFVGIGLMNTRKRIESSKQIEALKKEWAANSGEELPPSA